MKRKSDRPSKANLQRYRAYLRTPVEDWKAREELAINLKDLAILHKAWLGGSAPLSLYKAVRTILVADTLYKKDPDRCEAEGWPIIRFRWWLSRKKTRRYLEGGYEVHETISYHTHPVCDHITRVRTKLPRPTEIETELEFRYLHPIQDFEATWKRWQRELQEEAIELTQWIYETQLREDLLCMVFLPASKGIFYRYTVSDGTNHRSAALPLAEAYSGMLRKKAFKYRLSADKGEVFEVPLQEHSSDELSEALTAFLKGIRSYQPGRGAPAAGLERITRQGLFRAFKHLSAGLSPAELAELEYDPWWQPPKTDKQGPADKDASDAHKKRRLYSRIENSGGSLDAPTSGEEEGPLLSERLPSDAPTPEKQILLRERDRLYERIEQFLIGEVGREFFQICEAKRFHRVDWQAVANACNLPSADAARMKWKRAIEKAKNKGFDLSND